MVEIFGRMFISDKEASKRYGYSPQWFRLARNKKNGPGYIKMPGKGKVFYPLDETDNWFKENITKND
jgi:hypothetical protein